MKVLVISRPIYDYILPLIEYPMDGDNFYIENSIKTINNSGTLIAITLAKCGLNVSYTGMIGEDEVGRKIKELLDSYNIDTKYVETSYTEKTWVNYKIYNQKSNKFTTITERSLKTDLSKYKYEFIPDIVVMDDGDYGANLAAINNYPDSKLIYVGEKFTKDSLVYCNKCNYVICNINFASAATGITTNLNKPKNIVALFQKFVDLYKANLIIKLNNFDILYCVNDEVRLIKNINNNIVNKDNLFNSIFIYYLINTDNIEDSIKLTNKVLLSSNNDLDMIKNIPEYNLFKGPLEELNKVKNINNPMEQAINNEVNVNNEVNINSNDKITNNKTEVLETPILNNNINDEGVNEIEKL